MKIILHCGEPKTGSTAIQSYLHRHSARLLRQGVLYHANRLQKNHNSLLYLAGKNDQTPKNACTGVLQEVFATVRRIRRLCERERPRHLLLSSELFFKLTPYEMNAILERFEVPYEAVQAVVYLRSPVSYYTSMAQERAKYGLQLIAPHIYRRNILDRLEQWREYVGRENLTLLPFEPQNMTNGCIVSDFTDRLKAMTGADILPRAPFASNPSLSAEQAILIHDYRNEFCPEEASRATLSSLHMLRFFQAVKAAGTLPLTRPKLRPEHARAILANHRRHLEILERDYGVAFSREQAAPVSGKVEAHAEAAASATPSMEELLAPCNQEALTLLRRCIPEYGPRLPRLLHHVFFRCRLTRGSLSFARSVAVYRAGDAGRRLLERVVGFSALYKALNAAFAPRKAMERDPAYLHAHGTALRRQGELDAAVASFEQALALSPEQGDSHAELGALQLMQDKPDAALHSMHKALEHGAHTARAYTTLGRIHVKKEEPLNAQQAYSQALDLDPAAPGPHAEMGRLLLRQEEYDQAEAHIRKALALQATSGKHHQLLGQVLYHTGRVHEALQALQNAFALDGTLLAACSLLARTQASLGRRDDAAATLQRGLQQHPENFALRLQLGRLLLHSGRPEAAREALQHCIRLKPESPAAWQHLATALQRQGRLEHAASALDKALRLAPRTPGLERRLANLQEQLQDCGTT